jgi:hypothetical protein
MACNSSGSSSFMNRCTPRSERCLVRTMILLLAALCTRLASAADERPLRPGIHLLTDDHVIESQAGLVRELGSVTKLNDGLPILTDGRFYGTVLFDQNRFCMWYRNSDAARLGYGYAESSDGIAFRRLSDVEGIPFAGDFTMAVEIDPSAKDPQRRYIAGYDAVGMAAGIAHSIDGIHWIPDNDGKPVTKRAADSYNQIFYDPIAETYRLFTRTDFGGAGGSSELRGTRSMTNPDPAGSPTDWKIVREWIFDREGRDEASRRQIYAVACWIHRDVYFALLSVYEYPGDFSEGTETDRVRRHERDVMNYYLATSRDADSWDLRWVYEQKPLVPRGGDGAFDKDIVLPSSTIVTHDKRHWIYYCGADERHGNEQVRFDRRHAIGVATLPIDRFVALKTAAHEVSGRMLTKPILVDGDALIINADASAGRLVAELTDSSGNVISGYSFEESVPMERTDSLNHSITWKTAKVADLTGRTIRVRLALQDAELYSFGIMNEKNDASR